MKKKGIMFWLGLTMAGSALYKAGGVKQINLFEDYEYSNPFIMPKLYHPFWGNTFNHSTGSQMESSIGEKYADMISNRIEDIEGITLLPVDVQTGSSVITMKFKPMNNIKKSYSLQRQIKYAIGREDVRIFPDGDKIIVEMPFKGNKVLFGDFMHDKRYRLRNIKTEVPIGQNQKGEKIYGDISKMPHMLVAGATGSGKSVFLNGIITSLLMKNSPNDIRFILIDPKMVEFKRFETLKYVKYVSETPQAINVLSSLCKEMDKRYALLANKGCRDIDDYNRTYPNDPMPRIVLVIDELADMMLSGQKKQVETNIVRIAQKARASGIHMILATQKPTRDVMSGLIKANIPCRVALSVMSRTDSMVILDKTGAELLSGHGDLLYLDGICNKYPIRLQAGMLTTEEMENVIQPLVKENEPELFDEYYDISDMSPNRRKEFDKYYE